MSTYLYRRYTLFVTLHQKMLCGKFCIMMIGENLYTLYVTRVYAFVNVCINLCPQNLGHSEWKSIRECILPSATLSTENAKH